MESSSPIPKLADSQFAAFWGGLDAEDRYEFMTTNGGSEKLARFVACIDLLMLSGPREGRTPGTLQQAYVMATGCSAETAKREAYAAFHHRSVETLVDRLRYRDRVLVWTSIEMKYADLVKKQMERALEQDSDIKDRELALKAGAEFARQYGKAVENRARLTKRGFERGREAAAAAGALVLDDEKVKSWLAELLRLYGPDKLAQFLSEGAAEQAALVSSV